MMLAKMMVVAGLLAAPSAMAGGFSLTNYTHSATWSLPVAADEASAITYNWDTGTLFVLGDEGDAIVEVSAADGSVLSTMTLTGFDDTEGLTYIGGGQFVIGEERIQDVYRLTYTAGGSAARSTLASASIGPTVGNVGIEGFSYDPRNGRFVLVKEKTPQGVYDTAITFTAPPVPPGGPGPDINPGNLFDPALLSVLDLSDVQVLATYGALAGTAAEDQLLIYSQESSLLMHVTRAGAVLSTFSFAGIASDAEGVTIGADGTIYVCGETPEIYVLTPVPSPSGAALLGLWGLCAVRRRR